MAIIHDGNSVPITAANPLNVTLGGSSTPISPTNPLDVSLVGSSATSAIAITPHNTTTFAATKGLFIGVNGDVRAKMKDGTIITFKGLSVGVIHPISVTMVYVTGTTALEIVGVY